MDKRGQRYLILYSQQLQHQQGSELSPGQSSGRAALSQAGMLTTQQAKGTNPKVMRLNGTLYKSHLNCNRVTTPPLHVVPVSHVSCRPRQFGATMWNQACLPPHGPALGGELQRAPQTTRTAPSTNHTYWGLLPSLQKALWG